MSVTRRTQTLALAAFAAGALGLGIALPALGGDDAPAPKPVAAIKDVMYTMNEGPHSVFGVLKESSKVADCDDDGWIAIQARTTMMMEAGNMILGMKPPRGADDAAGLAAWKAQVLEYRNAAESAREAALKKDMEGVKTGLAAIGKRCTVCHKAHQKQE